MSLVVRYSELGALFDDFQLMQGIPLKEIKKDIFRGSRMTPSPCPTLEEGDMRLREYRSNIAKLPISMNEAKGLILKLQRNR